MKKWKLLYNHKSKVDEIVKILLKNRGLTNKKEIDRFLNPRLSGVTAKSVGINKNQLEKTIKRINKAIKKKEEVIVFGDYDVDGISGAAILWETLTEAGAKALPYIPHRLDEGYGLSKIGIDNLLLKNPKIKLIITVDNGIVASEAVEYANKKGIDIFEIGHVIAPRLNAMGRLEYAMDSLRLLCTKDLKRAEALTEKLGSTNKRRQELTISAFEHARLKITNLPAGKAGLKSQIPKLLFIAHESYQQGVIGLVAGRLVEEFYRPSIVLSIGEKYSKASARSIPGFNIIEFIRGASDLLVDAGGHPMAAGFTVETSKIAVLEKKFEELAVKLLDTEKLKRILNIDLEVLLSYINFEFYKKLQKLAPFGIGNPTPVFLSKNLTVEDMRLVGNDGLHLKLRVQKDGKYFDAIGFGLGDRADEVRIGSKIDLVYTIEENEWNGNNRLQLKIKDLRKD